MSAFAKKMMEKMGHVEGQGLGKDGAGIANPIEASSNVGRSGLGYQEQIFPTAFAPAVGAEDKDVFSSNIVCISNLDDGAEAPHVYQFFGDDLQGATKEIMSESGFMYYVVFATEADAEEAAQLDGRRYGDMNRAISIQLVRQEDVPDEKNIKFRITNFWKEAKADPDSRTVLIENLPYEHTRRAFNALMGFNLDTCDNERDEDEDDSMIIRIPDKGEALVQFASKGAAESIAEEFNGKCWRSRTLRAHRVSDDEMDEIVEEEEGRKTATGETIGLFVGGLHQSFQDEQYLRQLFHPIVLTGVEKQPYQRFAFVWMATADATTWMQNNPESLRYKGKFITTRLMEKKGKGKQGFIAPPRPQYSIRPGPPARHVAQPRATNYANAGGINGLVSKTAELSIKTPAPAPAPAQIIDVKITNLPFAATEQDVRGLFTGFNVKKVFIKRGKGFGFVSLNSNGEARRAASQLNGRQLLGRKIVVQIAPPKN